MFARVAFTCSWRASESRTASGRNLDFEQQSVETRVAIAREPFEEPNGWKIRSNHAVLRRGGLRGCAGRGQECDERNNDG